MELWTALTIGLFGSLHCVGMCGPIALSLPYQAATKVATGINALTYHGGRVLGYATIGILPGLLGQGLFIAGFQKNISLILGLLFFIGAIFSFGLKNRVSSIPGIRHLNGFIQRQLSQLLKKRSRKTFLSIGYVNAFLPCGLVYLALGGAVTQTSLISGALYMAMFGLGTLPMMFGLSLTGHLVSLKTRQYFRKLIPVFMLFFALLFVIRGLNIELPMDLRLWMDMGSPPMCH